ncbi:hypothetical protein H8E88_06015 [candidate division KSB1 bacterium]|nr:hypothetical protein [candidate division KSB1 bacterium]MBL7095145.1 hypothetical protein [candidate division KSB1 bacterium]
MGKDKIIKEPLPDNFNSIAEAAEFWDSHSLSDYEEYQKDIDIEVELKKEKNYFAIEKDLSDIVDKVALSKGILPETLINLWLKEKIIEKQI